ncbi:hypothetical protein Ddye_031628 [Dipteronia dyeriana]|uniref:Uncharacterized protein n=1 Tax=Dipteronia dyeriana TaxID=168575 RepID=A0AAD9TIW8_9ROSI|nr:hypothetical protein Ddye_031628 [Dipteronia dyeriana]
MCRCVSPSVVTQTLVFSIVISRRSRMMFALLLTPLLINLAHDTIVGFCDFVGRNANLLGVWLTVDDVANAVLFLASSEASNKCKSFSSSFRCSQPHQVTYLRRPMFVEHNLRLGSNPDDHFN